MLARSGKVSMATKKRSGEEINDRQILCGMGIKLRRLTAGIATLIPVLNGVHQAGLSTTIQFTRAEDKIMSGTVSVNGTDLPTTTFPTQGFTGAYYQMNNDNFAPGKTAADYLFQARPPG